MILALSHSPGARMSTQTDDVKRTLTQWRAGHPFSPVTKICGVGNEYFVFFINFHKCLLSGKQLQKKELFFVIRMIHFISMETS